MEVSRVGETHLGVNQAGLEMKTADIVDKDLWVSKFKRLTAKLEDLTRQKDQFAQSHKWSEVESLPTTEKLVYRTWNALSDSYKNMKTYAFGVLSYMHNVQKLACDIRKQKSP
ncbi:General transcription factor II-I repeat domain-containing protein 2-like [Caligus rogercresseyi]|uniref:General transcription factor II-I repeat domain-containing protein 2-like n=1 Tax=Caligus rogercresseyi TaxID=217165 RepID=A0A7T8JZE4_CALRO|nr:General transcription factor II-I repeat domain-containing protein 2-like [Caligus rogercresseyi]